MLPAEANGRYLPLPNVIRSGAKMTSPVTDTAVLLKALHRSLGGAADAAEAASIGINASAGGTRRNIMGWLSSKGPPGRNRNRAIIYGKSTDGETRARKGSFGTAYIKPLE